MPERNDGGAPDVSEPRPGARPFALLAAAPDKGLREKQMRAMMAEAKRRVRTGDARKREKQRQKPKATVVPARQRTFAPAHAASGAS